MEVDAAEDSTTCPADSGQDMPVEAAPVSDVFLDSSGVYKKVNSKRSAPLNTELTSYIAREQSAQRTATFQQSADTGSELTFQSDVRIELEDTSSRLNIPVNNDGGSDTTLTIGLQAHRQWRDIATQWHLSSDSEVACFLIQYFQETRENSPVLCTTCKNPLTLRCTKCDQLTIKSSSLHVGHSHGSSLGDHDSELDEDTDDYQVQVNPLVFAAIGTINSTGDCMHKGVKTEDNVCFVGNGGGSVEKEHVVENSTVNTFQDNTGRVASLPSKVCRNTSRQSRNGTLGSSDGCSYSNDDKGINSHFQQPKANQSPICEGETISVEYSSNGQRNETASDQHDQAMINSRPLVIQTSACIRKKGSKLKRPLVQKTSTIIRRTRSARLQGKNKTSNILKSKLRASNSVDHLKRIKEKRTDRKSFSCNVCDKSFSERGLLKSHVRTHIGERPFSCTHCYSTFKEASALREHISTHAMDKLFPCDKCSKSYRTSKHLQTHQRHCHRNEQPFVCTVCEGVYKTKGSLNFHMKSHSRTKPVEKNFVCSTCGDAFARKSTLQNHVLRHTGEKPHVCLTCGAAFNALSTLIVHKRTHTGDKPYVCSHCQAAFIQSSDLGKHVKRKHSDVKPFECAVCHLKYATRSDLNKHLVNCTHTRPKGRQRQPSVCDLCGAIFKDAGYLRVHKMRHLGQKPFVCDECGWAFVVNSELQAHMKIHSGHKPFICDQCGASFFNSGSLRKHQQRHGDESAAIQDSVQARDEKPFLCAQCGESFKTQAYLNDHSKAHTQSEGSSINPLAHVATGNVYSTSGYMHKGVKQVSSGDNSKQPTQKKPIERNFICSTCGAAFGKKSILQNHVRRHTGEKPHVCTTCSAAFRALSTLIVHKRSHTGERPYVCSQCGAAFIQSSDLNKHVKRNHGDHRPFDCKLCGAKYATKKDLNKHFASHAVTDTFKADVRA